MPVQNRMLSAITIRLANHLAQRPARSSLLLLLPLPLPLLPPPPLLLLLPSWRLTCAPASLNRLPASQLSYPSKK